jgi:Phage P22-like portal protein
MFFNQAMRRTGLVLVDLIPKIYDTVRTVRILGEDMTDKVVKINQQYVDEDGKPRLYDLKAGRYDVKIEIGPSAITRRQENLDSIIEMTKAVPGIAMTSPDLIVRNADFEYSDEIAARLQAGLPPGLKDKADQLMSGDKSGPKPEVVALQQMGQQLQQMQGAVQKLAQENQQLKQRDQQAQVQIAQMKMQADMQREQLKATNNLQVADMNNKADIQQEIIRQQGQAQRNIPMRPAAVPVPMRNNFRQ